MIKLIEELKSEFKMRDGEIAKLVGVTPKSIRFWRSGERNPKEINRNKLVDLRNRLKTENREKWYVEQAYDFLR